MTGCTSRVLVLVLVVAAVSAAATVREWKNFENGKVYSHRTLNSKNQEETEEENRVPVTEERMLHGHHKERKMHHQLKSKRLLVNDDAHENPVPQTEIKSKNNERHHRKNVEEEMHLRPLNERHHKFPNLALLNTVEDGKTPSPQISKQKLIKQVKSRNKTNGKRMLRGRRYKRNRTGQTNQLFTKDNISTEPTVPKTNKIENVTANIKKSNTGKTRKSRELQKDTFLPKLPYLW